MSFLKVLGKVLKVTEAVAPQVATALNPAAGAVVGLVVDSVTKAEQAGGSGAEKKAAVIKDVVPAATSVVTATLQAKGTTVNVDPAQLTTAVGGLVDGVVGLLNSVKAPAAAGADASADAASTPSGAAGAGSTSS